MSDEKTCYTCAHRCGSWCTLTKSLCSTARYYEHEPCNANWSGWTPRPVEVRKPCLLVRLMRLFIKLRRWGL